MVWGEKRMKLGGGSMSLGSMGVKIGGGWVRKPQIWGAMGGFNELGVNGSQNWGDFG